MNKEYKLWMVNRYGHRYSPKWFPNHSSLAAGITKYVSSGYTVEYEIISNGQTIEEGRST